jgi:hypothetical protein
MRVVFWVFAKELMVDKYHGFFIFFASAACCHCGAESSYWSFMAKGREHDE